MRSGDREVCILSILILELFVKNDRFGISTKSSRSPRETPDTPVQDYTLGELDFFELIYYNTKSVDCQNRVIIG